MRRKKITGFAFAARRFFGLAAIVLLCQGCSPQGTSPAGGAAVGETSVETPVLKTSGATMGTYYAVTIADPPASLGDDWKEQIDGELRQVNDQMSTYLSTSELSRFNASESTDWFAVSPDTAFVVQAALDIAERSDGALDVTVGPLVDAWSFGPGERSQKPPSDEEIAELRKRVGFEHLSARLEPPALKKDLPNLRVDLSAIAKGHGVDRVVELLRERGCENAFVDIGGEDRAIGRRGGRPWRVAIEDPSEHDREYHLVFALRDTSIATSGDYRNFFMYEGRRYSHTIDPRTGRPTNRNVASVSVFHDSCMMADGWATVLGVLGPASGMELARKEGLTVRMVIRQADGSFVAHETDRFPDSILEDTEAER